MNNRKYTFVQYFFWLFAGSEIHILKTCETDYNRHARLGFIIFIVTLIAGCAGALAGYTFSGGHWELVKGSYKFTGGNIYASVTAGTIWALLIFGIDSNMVTTIKKDPNNPLQKWGSLFWSRAIIGFFIAAFISIPLEILIFHEDVLIQMEKDKANQIIDMKNKQTSIYDINALGKEQERKDKDKKAQDSIASLGCDNCSSYQEKKGESNNCEKELAPKKARYLNLKNEVQRMRREGNLNNVFFQKKNALQGAQSFYSNQQQICSALAKEASRICQKYKDSTQKLSNKADSAVKAVTLKVDNNKAKVDSITNSHSEQLTGLRGFTRQFVALEHASHEDVWVFVLLWLVRLIFIGLEILPTYTKLSTPIGDYDKAIRNAESLFEEKLKTDKLIGEYTERIRGVIESKRNHDAIQSMAEAENEIAAEIIDEWKRQEKLGLIDKVNNFRKG